MAISEHKNGHFEEIRGWLQILELVSNSTIFHLLFDTYDSPGAVFIWKWEKYRPYLLVWGSARSSKTVQVKYFINPCIEIFLDPIRNHAPARSV